MARNSAPDPKKLTLLSVGAVAALGVAGWRITEAMGPGASPRGPVPATASQSAPAQPAGQAGQPAETPGLSPDISAREPGLASTQGGTSEEMLALSVDPFAGFTRVQQIGLASPSLGRKGAPGGLFSPGPLPPGGLLPPRQSQPQAQPAPEELPQLVGTLLGERPGAVFKTDGGVQVVHRGELIDAWRVVAIEHGTAIVRRGQFTRQLTVRARLGADQSTSAPGMVGVRSGNGRPISIPEGMAAAPATRVRENDPDVSPSEILVPPTTARRDVTTP